VLEFSPMVERLGFVIKDLKDGGFHAGATVIENVVRDLRGKKLIPDKLPSLSVWQQNKSTGEKFYRHDNFSFFPEKGLVIRRDGAEAPLSLMQLKALAVLVNNINTVVKKKELVREIWGKDCPYDKNAQACLQALIKRLRNGIEPNSKKPEIIITSTRPYSGYSIKDKNRESISWELRPELKPEKIFHYSGFTYFPERGLVTVDGKDVNLTKIENTVLKLLAENPDRVVEYCVFERKISADDRDYSDIKNAIRTHIINIRRKIEPNVKGTIGKTGQYKHILTVKGAGYKLVDPGKSKNG